MRVKGKSISDVARLPPNSSRPTSKLPEAGKLGRKRRVLTHAERQAEDSLKGSGRGQCVKAGPKACDCRRTAVAQAQFQADRRQSSDEKEGQRVERFSAYRLVVDKHDINRNDEAKQVDQQALPEHHLQAIAETAEKRPDEAIALQPFLLLEWVEQAHDVDFTHQFQLVHTLPGRGLRIKDPGGAVRVHGLDE